MVDNVRNEITNEQILEFVYQGAGYDYQRRIPHADQASIQEQMQAIADYKPGFNEFAHALVNQIGLNVFKSVMFENEFAQFKRASLNRGDTIQEINVGLSKAHTYSAERDYLEKDIWGQEQPSIQTNYHKINRQDFYKVTLNDMILRRALVDGGDLSSFTSELMESPLKSDNYDEFLIAHELLNHYADNDGFYKVNVPNVSGIDSDGAMARLALRKLRFTADEMGLMRSQFNAAKVPMTAKKSELILLCSPQFKAALDVEALAQLFHLDKGDFFGRVITVDPNHIKIPGFQAVLTTPDFYLMADTYYGTEAAPKNPAGLTTNHFLHHHGIYSASRFAPAVLFTTEAGSEVIEVNSEVTAISTPAIQDANGETGTTVNRGSVYLAQATVSATDPSVNTAKVWSLTGAVGMKSGIDQNGILHIDPREESESVTVIATSVGQTSAGETVSDQIALTVAGDPLPAWPNNTEPEPRAATASATVDEDAVTSILVTDGGAGYTVAPNVTISGDGSEATAKATIAKGVVTDIEVTAGGTGYPDATVTVDAP